MRISTKVERVSRIEVKDKMRRGGGGGGMMANSLTTLYVLEDFMEGVGEEDDKNDTKGPI